MANIRAGLHKISENNNDNLNSTAVIFIHGWRGDPFNTWMNNKGLILPEIMSHDKDLESFIFYSFGYKSTLGLFQYNFHEIARLLNSSISANIHANNIILIGHSMGGLVAQQYVVSLFDNHDIQSVKKVKGIAYLSVPFGGSFLANIIPIINSQIESLREKRNPLLKELKEKWNAYVYRGGNPLSPSVFKHEISQIALYGSRDLVVNKESAAPFHLGADIFPVDKYHKDICKIDENDDVYKLLKKFILTCHNRVNTNVISPQLSNDRIICLFDLAYFGLSIHNRLGWLFGQFSDFDESIKEFRRLMNDLNIIVIIIFKDDKQTEILKMLQNLSDYVLPYVLGEKKRSKGWEPANELAESIQDRLSVLEYTLNGMELATFKLGQYLGKWDNSEPIFDDKLSESTEKLILQLIEQLSFDKQVPEEIVQIFKEYRNTESISAVHTPHRIYNKVRTMLMINSINGI